MPETKTPETMTRPSNRAWRKHPWGTCGPQIFDTLTNILKYLKRMEEEWQVIFGVALAKHKTKSAIAFANREFAKWAADNEDLL